LFGLLTVAIPVAKPTLPPECRENLLAAYDSGQFTMGPWVARFEQAFGQCVSPEQRVETLAVASGTAALHVVLAALDIGPGDEVVVPALTFVATANAVRYTGATPVICDVDPVTWCLDARQVRVRLTSRTRAVIPVDLYGYPAPLDDLAHQVQAPLVEDACEALGARREMGVGEDPRVVATVFSCYGNKTITTGEGGLITASRPLAERMRHLLRNGQSPARRYYHDVVGFNYRMTDLAAAVGCGQLPTLAAMVQRRQEIIRYYRRQLPWLQFQPEPRPGRGGFWAAAALCPDRYTRDAIVDSCGARGIETRPFFTPLDQLPMYAAAVPSPVAHHLASVGVLLPCYASLTVAECDRVCRAVEAAA
jgi:perosamine synthetase